ncbi:basic salivary proline-rich protein 1-like [Anopheles ziemanni]|uniref:basic salivary proline-rich protein 1-like n=1 Tax=Anopheles coustani TaxID=139045 RepID=UPI0026594CB6|nr:basic salivary proline-rich protein 1-like [Anopheles coustani]XP_058171877.1 basic salivary proline-rich protein 1-like [Anopheles ziemanni]
MIRKTVLTAFCAVLGLASAARLDNLYGAPAPAASYQGGGGDSNVLNAPRRDGQFGGVSPANQYLPPSAGGQQGGYPSVAPLGQPSGPGPQQGPFGGAYNPQPSGPSYGGSGNALRPSGPAGGFQGNSFQPQTTPIPILRYENVNNGDGSYRFDYATGNGIQHQEEGFLRNLGPEKSEQVVSGGYSYTAPDGQQYSVQYKADANGFQPVGDHLPTPPPLPVELQEAYDLHARLHAEAAARPKNPAYQEPQAPGRQYGAPQPQGGVPQGQYYPQQTNQYQPPQQPQQPQQPQYQQPQPQYHHQQTPQYQPSSPNAIQGYPSAPANQYLPPNKRQQGFNPNTGYTY